MSRKLNRILLVGGLAVLCSCKPSIPRDVIDPDDMEDILYDYHLADAAASLNSDSTRSYNARLYQLAVLKKHGVTETQFDSSMVYYTRHTEKLYAIWRRVKLLMSGQVKVVMPSSQRLRSINRHSSSLLTHPTIRVIDSSWSLMPSSCIRKECATVLPFFLQDFLMIV